MIKLRQRLLPYLYTLFEECHRTGAPILRPLLFEYPEDETTYTADDEFLLGDALLVAPISRPGVEHRHVYLPEGTWIHFWTGERLDGPAHVLAHAPLGEPAVYLKANTPLPMGPDAPHTGAADDRPADPGGLPGRRRERRDPPPSTRTPATASATRAESSPAARSPARPPKGA